MRQKKKMGKTLFSKILGTNSGAALLQVMMVGTAIMTGSFYMTMQNNVSLKAIAGEYYAMELFTFEERLKEVLVDNQACSELFRGASVPAAGPAATFVRLNPSGYGLLASRDPADQRGFNLGENGMFEIPDNANSIRLVRASAVVSAPYEEFVVLQIDVGINQNFVQGFIGPRVVTKQIPLFATWDAANLLTDCFYDPGDPDRTDGIADGLVSRGLRDLCTSTRNPGNLQPVWNPNTATCFDPGLPLIGEIDPGTPEDYLSLVPAGGTEGTNMANLRIVDAPTTVSINGVNVDLGNQPRVGYDYEPSPLWIPRIGSCGPNQMVAGLQRNNDGTPPWGFSYSYICSGITEPEVRAVIDESVNTDCVNGFAIDQSGAGGRWRLNCAHHSPGVLRNGGGTVPVR